MQRIKKTKVYEKLSNNITALTLLTYNDNWTLLFSIPPAFSKSFPLKLLNFKHIHSQKNIYQKLSLPSFSVVCRDLIMTDKTIEKRSETLPVRCGQRSRAETRGQSSDKRQWRWMNRKRPSACASAGNLVEGCMPGEIRTRLERSVLVDVPTYSYHIYHITHGQTVGCDNIYLLVNNKFTYSQWF